MQELSGVSEAARDLAMSRFRLIQPYLEQKRSLQLVASDANICFRTAQRWVSQYRKLGLVALVRKSREDRGARRVVSAKIKAAIEGVTLHSIRGLRVFIFQYYPCFYYTVTVLKSRTFVFKSRMKLSRKSVRDLNAKRTRMGNCGRGRLGRSTP
jgi:hypothetical protein